MSSSSSPYIAKMAVFGGFLAQNDRFGGPFGVTFSTKKAEIWPKNLFLCTKPTQNHLLPTSVVISIARIALKGFIYGQTPRNHV